jgi:hypothetical protein
MEEGAPAAIVLAASLTASGWIALHRDGLVVDATGYGRVSRAPANVEDLGARIRIGLARRAIRTRDRRRVSDGFSHRFVAISFKKL